MHKLFPFIAFLLLFQACSPTTSENSITDLTALANEYWAFQLDTDPFLAADAGEINDTLLFPDLSLAALKERASRDAQFFQQLQAIDKAGLSMEDLVLFEVLELQLRDNIAGREFGEQYLRFQGDESFVSSFSYLIQSLPFENAEDYDNYIRRLKAFPSYVDQNIILMQTGLERGIFQPAVVVHNLLTGLRSYVVTDPTNHPYFAPFSSTDPAGMESMAEEGKKVITDEVIPAFQKLEIFLEEEYLPKADRAPGVSNLPEGRIFYENKVAYFTTLKISPDSVFSIGKREVERIKTEMDSLIVSTGFEGEFDDFLKFLRTDQQFYPKTGEELLAYASRIAKKADGKLPGYFNILPRLPYGVIPVPEEIAPYYTAGRYSPGSIKNHKAGNYLVNTYKLDSRPLYAYPALTLHEAVPGHHLQISLAKEMPEQHPLLQNMYLSAFGEGWALYCEWLGKEMGMYETPYDEFGRLTYEMWRACRLVVDVGLHYKGWTREEAFDFLASNTALSLHEVGTEIDRYIGWPGQALSYKMGELRIRQLRKLAEKELGDNFDLRAYHDKVLSRGSVPLTTLTKMVESWIAENKD